MKIVLDTNVIIAALLKDSIIRETIILSGHDLFIPEKSLEEIKKYEGEIIAKSGLSSPEIYQILEELLSNIIILPYIELKDFMPQAEKIMKDIDIKDSVFIAAALSINADGIWSYDNHFKMQDLIRVVSINELL